MKRPYATLIFAIAMTGLLAALAVLQYVWLGKISDGERDRLRSRLEADTRRFADEFNREIQSAYFNFQLPPHVWKEKKWNEFSERYDFWHDRTAYPELIRSISFVDLASGKTEVFDPSTKIFKPAELSAALAPVKPYLTASGAVRTVVADVPALLLPIHEMPANLKRIVVSSDPKMDIPKIAESLPERSAFVVVELDPEVIKGRIFADLKAKYFSESGSEYDLAIIGPEGVPFVSTSAVSAPESTARLLDLAPENFIFYSNRELLPKTEGVTRSVVFSATTQKIETHSQVRTDTNGDSNVELKVVTDDIRPRINVREVSMSGSVDAPWTLTVQHSAGSIESFVNATRWRNLAISFGILGLLGVSVLFIFVSAQRARTIAQRQVDFVSSVSHEFRTPLAVIYSASENLADGVAREPAQIARYGELIKGEGRKLSSMVEQILEFAGARSGKRRFDFREVPAGEIVANAIEETRPMLEDAGFTLETWIDPDLPMIRADRNAMSQAIQNLIVNALKYSNGSRWVRIEAERSSSGVTIAVIDRGIGIEPKDLKKIFEPFFRARHVVDEQIHGNGLGLSLVKETVTAHGGRIDVESRPGEGSRFVISL